MVKSTRLIVGGAIGITAGIIFVGWLLFFRPRPFHIERLEGTAIIGRGYIHNRSAWCIRMKSVHCPAPHYVVLDRASINLLRAKDLMPPPEIKFDGDIAVFKRGQDDRRFDWRIRDGFLARSIHGEYTPILNPECSRIPRISDALPSTRLGCLSGMYIGPALLIDEIQ